jgi:YidC/Oxa1 family membrane protein insertase
MERRVLLAITLSFLVLFLFQRFVMPPPPDRVPVNASATSAPAATPGPASGAAAVPAGASGAPNQASSAPAAGNATPAGPTMTLAESSAREIVVETKKVRAVFSNQGARLTHWVLKDFRTDSG